MIRHGGIAYARALRWARPAPVSAAPLGLARACPQLPIARLDEALPGSFDGLAFDEDCTQLTITRPEAGRDLPVMVWIHGGSYESGAADMALFDPSVLVSEQGVITVSVSYRLGLFGWLGHARSPANLGLFDLIAALNWLRGNIADYGGDPGNITLFGQSSGGDAIARLMVAEGAQGLFHRAIIQSAPLELQDRAEPLRAVMRREVERLPDGATTAQVLAVQAGLRRRLMRFGLRGFMPFGPEHGAAPLPARGALDAAFRRVAPQIDLLIGHTRDEAALFLPPAQGLARLADPARRLAVGALTRRLYARPARRFAARHRASGGQATRFVIDWPGGALGRAHLGELPLLFPGPTWLGSPLVPEGMGLSALTRTGAPIRALWAGFARDGRVGESLPGVIRLSAV